MKPYYALIWVTIIFLAVWFYPIPDSWRDTNVWVENTAKALGHPDDTKTGGPEMDMPDRELLRYFRPRVYSAPNDEKPIDFYRDYLPNTKLRVKADQSKVLKGSPSRSMLNAFRNRNDIYLDYVGPDTLSSKRPKAYPAIYRERVNIIVKGKIQARSFTFLKYNFVFLHRGLPVGMPQVKGGLLKLLGRPDRWQELDVHAAVYVVLDESRDVIALVLGQYEHFRTYLRGVDFEVPGDGRVRIAFSERSHQPYLLPEGETPVERRAVLKLKGWSYLLTASDMPFLAGFDTVYSKEAGAKEIDYALEFLPQFDVLFTARFPLGEAVFVARRFEIALRRGPLGMDFATWPQLTAVGNLMQFWYLRDGDSEQAAFMDLHLNGFSSVNFDPILLRNGARFGEDLSGTSARSS